MNNTTINPTFVPLRNNSGKKVGYAQILKQEKTIIYRTEKDALKNQIFLKKDKGSVGLDLSIIQRLLQIKEQIKAEKVIIIYTINNWNLEGKHTHKGAKYEISYELTEFINKSKTIEYEKQKNGGKQKIIPLTEGKIKTEK